MRLVFRECRILNEFEVIILYLRITLPCFATYVANCSCEHTIDFENETLYTICNDYYIA